MRSSSSVFFDEFIINCKTVCFVKNILSKENTNIQIAFYNVLSTKNVIKISSFDNSNENSGHLGSPKIYF